MAQPLAIKQFGVTGSDWTSFAPTINCNHYVLTTPVDLKIRTSLNDGTTEKIIPANSQDNCFGLPTREFFRFGSGITILYMQAVSAIGTVVGDFII